MTSESANYASAFSKSGVSGVAVTVVGKDTGLVVLSRFHSHGYENRKQRRQEAAANATVKTQLALKRSGGGVEGKKKGKKRQVM